MMKIDKIAKPTPIPDPDSLPFWKAAHDHRLMIQKCSGCGRLMFPPGPRCRNCLSDQLHWTEVSGKGTIYTFGIMQMPLVPGFKPPYIVAVVELDEQGDIRMNANIIDCAIDAPYIGMPVEVTFEDVNDEISLPQFRPCAGATPGGRQS